MSGRTLYRNKLFQPYSLSEQTVLVIGTSSDNEYGCSDNEYERIYLSEQSVCSDNELYSL